MDFPVPVAHGAAHLCGCAASFFGVEPRYLLAGEVSKPSSCPKKGLGAIV